MTLYQLHELGRAWMAPLAYMAEANARIFSAPTSWLSNLPGAEQLSAANELLYRNGSLQNFVENYLRNPMRQEYEALPRPA